MAEFSLTQKVAGAPTWVWIGGTVVVGGAYFVIRSRRAAKNADQTPQAQSAPESATAGNNGFFSTDQAEAIFSDIRNLQGQETQFAGTASNLSNQLTSVGSSLGTQIGDVGKQVAKIPNGPPGPVGPPGQAGPPPAPPPPPPPPRPPAPTYHEAQVRTDGKHSIQFYASAYGTSINNILQATARAESSDYNSARSLLHKYVTTGRWSNVVPAGYTLFVPYYR